MTGKGCPLLGGTILGGSFIGGSTVVMKLLTINCY